MSNEQNPPVWTGPVIRFIKDSLPVLNPKGKEWDHMCATAYQFGSEALVPSAKRRKSDATQGRWPAPGGQRTCPDWAISAAWRRRAWRRMAFPSSAPCPNLCRGLKHARLERQILVRSRSMEAGFLDCVPEQRVQKPCQPVPRS